jgi:hypothetical protein
MSIDHRSLGPQRPAVGFARAMAVAFAAGCVIASLIAMVASAAYAAEYPAEGPTCPNEAVRVGYSHSLAHCRAYERVSPAKAEPEFLFVQGDRRETGVESEGNGTAKEVQAAISGNRFAYVTTYPPEGSPSDGGYLRVTRGPDGWSTEAMIPSQSAHYGLACRSGYVAAYSPELTSEVLADGVGQPSSDISLGVLSCGTDDPQLVAGEPQGFQNLFLAESEPGPYQLVDEIGQAPAGFSPAGAWFQDSSEDLSHIVFSEAARLTPEAPPVEQVAELTKEGEPEPLPDLYEWTPGDLRLVTVLPSGAPVMGSLANGYLPANESFIAGAAPYTHAVSSNGSRVFFQAGGSLYLRLNAEQPQSPVNGQGQCSEPADACTLQVDASEGGAEEGGGKFMWATADGTRAFFLDDRRLTANATAASEAPDLYEYDSDAPAGERLHDLTADAAEPADVQGVSGISEDGSYVYFVAHAPLVEKDNPAGKNAAGAEAVAGQPNLYLWHAGTISFIATLSSNDSSDWESNLMTSRVTPDGAFLAFNSELPLTGYDNVDVATGKRDDEIFLFSAAGGPNGTLTCASCSPTNAPSTANAFLPPVRKPVFGGGSPILSAGRLQQNLADDGRVFFSTEEQLLTEAANGQMNVYEYEAGAPHPLRLISTGTSGDPSYFYEASANGSNVFFITSQDLPSDESAKEFMVYDAREGGGFPVPPSPQEACTGEGCRTPAASPPGFALPPTAGSLPSGNVTPPAAKPPTGSHPKSAAELRHERLVRGLAQCRKLRAKHKRAACEARERKKYGAKPIARKGRR